MILNNLQIMSFRGATKPITIDFDRSKKITMIFADNGNGKSTIADALICLLTNEKGSLDDKSSIDTQFIKSLDADEAKITLNTDDKSFTATLSGATKDFVKIPSEGLPEIRFLRRTQIIDLLNLKPSQRYESLKNYIDVSGVYKSEEELRSLCRDIENDLDTTVSVLSNAKDTLEQAWIKEGKPNGDMLVWAKTESEKDLSKDKKDLIILQGLSNQWRSIENKYVEIKQTISTVSASKKVFQETLDALQKLQKDNEKNNTLLLSLLQQAKQYIVAQPVLNICPVCSNTIEKNEVVTLLEKQIESMNALGKAVKGFEDAKKNHNRNTEIQKKTVENFSNLLIVYKNSISCYKESVREIEPFVNGIGADMKENYTCYVTNVKALESLAERIRLSETKKSKSIDQYNIIKTQFISITLNDKKIDNIIKLSKAAAKALTIVEASRKEYYDSELHSISDEVEMMYQYLHPDEGLGGIKLFLNPKYKTSLELQAKFHSVEDITPQSVYSESHLDTLGISIFLALAKKNSDGNTLLVLDDVVMSVDDKHLDKFIDLLHNEAAHFGQIIITTHYRPWRDRYRNNRAPSGNVHFLELRNWSKENGIRVFNGKLILDELKQMLENEDNFHRENISSASGRVLENILDYLTIKFSSRLPRKPKNDFQLHELITGLSKELLKVFKVEHFTIDENGRYTVLSKTVVLNPIIEKLKQLKAIRNQVGAHFNFDGSLVSDEDIIEFGKTTLEFAGLLICPITGSLPDRNNSGSYWETKIGSIRLYPLVDPK